MSTRIMAVTNQKGGVAKTTTTVNVAACAAEMGRRVLVVDLDPQDANATRWMTTSAPALGVWQVLAEEASVRQAVVPSAIEGVDVLAASAAMSSVERLAGSQPGMEMVLGQALRKVRGYDLVLIDCPPALGLLTVSGLVAAREVVIPVTLDVLALAGVAQLLRSIEQTTQRLNPGLEVAAVVPCRVAPREIITREVLAALIEQFGAKVTPSVRRAAVATHSPGHHQALTTYAPTAGVTQDYRAVTAALLREGEK